jgi:PAS domain S-box-containing protein
MSLVERKEELSMIFAHSSSMILLFFNTVILVWLALHAFSRRSANDRHYLSHLLAVVALWSLAALFEEMATTIPMKIIWSKVSYVGVVCAAPLLFLFILEYCGLHKYSRARYLVFLWFIPLMVFVAALTNEFHGLVWPSVSFNNELPGSRAIFAHGPLKWVMAGYSYLLLMAGSVFIIRTASRTHDLYRSQLIILFSASILPWAGNLVYLTGYGPPGLDLTPIAFTVSGIVISVGIKRYQFLRITPIAHDNLFRSMTNGMLVLDESLRLLNFNPSIKTMFNLADSDIGKLVNTIHSLGKEVIEHLINTSEGHAELKLRLEGKARWLDIEGSVILNHKGKKVGSLYSFWDITAQKNAEVALLESEKKYRELSTLLRLLADNMPDMLWAKNLKKEYIFANKAICTSLLNAVDTDEPIEKNDMFFALRERHSRPEDPEWHTFGEICRDSDAITLGEMRPMQFDEYGNVKGKYLFLDVHKAPLFDAEGKLIGVVGSARDVTANKAAEIQLRRLSQAVEQSPSSVVITDLDGNIDYINPKFTETTGYTLEETMGQNPRLLKSGEHPEAYYKVLWETISSGKEWRGEFLNKKKNGELFWESASISPIKNEIGELTHYLEVKEDITGQKQAREKIRITRDTYQSIFNTVSEAIYILDEGGIFIDVNRGAELMYGYSREELTGMSPETVSAPGMNDLPAVNRAILSVLKSGIPDQLEFWGIRKNGEIFPKDVIVNKGTYFGKDCIIATARDITERKKLDDDLKHQAGLRELLMEISSGFINIPLEQVDDAVRRSLKQMGRFVNADRSYIFEYDWENEVCHNTFEWCAEGISSEIENLQNLSIGYMGGTVVAHRRGESDYIPDVLALDQSSERKILESQGIKSLLTVPMINDEYCIGFVGFDSVRMHHKYAASEIQLLKIFAEMLVNVKLRKEMVGQIIIAKERAVESDRLKSAFLANMSHEIRTPMNGILGFSQILKEPGLSGDEQQEYIRLIEVSGARMLNIINDIIDISKIEAGLMELNVSESNINEQIEYIFTFFKPEVDAKGLKLSLSIPTTARATTLITDREKLYAILTNLVKNAVKFTENGEIEVGYVLQSNTIEFFIRDTGIGIPKEHHKAIFERFGQADVNNKMARQGAGLGLSISKAYVEKMGGKIWVESTQGKGSTFFFTLPCNIKQEEIPGNKAKRPAEEATLKISHLNILVAEDDKLSEILLVKGLKKFTGEIQIARSGTEAVGIMRENPGIDLILMDIQMKGMDGYEATGQIRQFNREVIIIAQTAYGLSGDREKALEAGCNDYIAKPVNMAELHELIQKYFNKKAG